MEKGKDVWKTRTCHWIMGTIRLIGNMEGAVRLREILRMISASGSRRRSTRNTKRERGFSTGERTIRRELSTSVSAAVAACIRKNWTARHRKSHWPSASTANPCSQAVTVDRRAHGCSKTCSHGSARYIRGHSGAMRQMVACGNRYEKTGGLSFYVYMYNPFTRGKSYGIVCN